MGSRLNPALLRSLELSQQLLAAAETANMSGIAVLDAERLQLLKSFRREARYVQPDDDAILREIARLNNRAIGLLEHRRRGKGREMDMAAVGRKAVAAYSGTRRQR